MKRLIVFYRALLPAYQFLAWKEARCSSWRLCQVVECEYRQFLGRRQNAGQQVAQKSRGLVVQIHLGAAKLISSELISHQATP